MSYRKNTRVNVSDAERAVRWLRENDHSECCRIPAPEVAKDAVRKLINSGIEVPGCSLVEERSCSLK